MSQHYSDPSRASDPHALPDVEMFYLTQHDIDQEFTPDPDSGTSMAPGWYYWFCFPGCLPDSDPVGPFATEQEAIEDFELPPEEQDNG